MNPELSRLMLGMDMRETKHPKSVFVGTRKQKTASGKVRTVTRVSEEKRGRYSGADLRKLRAERGVGSVRKIAA